MADAVDHLTYLRNRMSGDATDAALWAQVDVDRREYWRGFAVASLIAAGIARVALERLDTEATHAPDPA